MSVLGGSFEESFDASASAAASRIRRPDGRLEAYLAEAERGLGALSDAERGAELAEMRSHLESLSAAYRELGLGEAEALDAALAQFGSAGEVSGRIAATSRALRERPLRQLGGAALTAVAGAALAFAAYESLIFRWSAGNSTYAMIAWPSQLVEVAAPVALGALIGKSFPKALWARVPVGIGAAVWLLALAQHFGGALASLPGLISALPSLLISGIAFVTLAWAAQSASRHPARTREIHRGGLAAARARLADFGRRLPDSWVGGLALGTAASAALHALTGAASLLMHGIRPLARLDAEELLSELPMMFLVSLACGILTGRTLPRRGWQGALVAGALSIPPMVLSCVYLSKELGAGVALTLGLTEILAMAVNAGAAFFIGRRRK